MTHRDSCKWCGEVHSGECIREDLKLHIDNLASTCAVLLLDAADMQVRISELEENIAESNEAYRITLEEKCPDDEKHCTCVPHLRKRIAELEGRLETAEDTLREYGLQYCAFCGCFQGVVHETDAGNPYCHECYEEWPYECPQPLCDMRAPCLTECVDHEVLMVERSL